MIGILILTLSILFAGALPWWPYNASGRSRHHRPWDWLMDQGGVADHIKGTPRLEDDSTASLAEQLAAVFEKSHVTGGHDSRQDRLAA